MVSQRHSFLAPWWNPDPAIPRDEGQWWSEPKLEWCTLVHTCACKHTHSGYSLQMVCPSSLSPLEVLHIFPLPGTVWSNSQVPASERFFVIKLMLRTVAGTEWCWINKYLPTKCMHVWRSLYLFFLNPLKKYIIWQSQNLEESKY